MIVKRVVVVFWCLFYCVMSEITGVQFVKPTPVLDIVMEIRSTDARNPLKFNKESGPQPLTTGIAVPPDGKGLVNPTSVLTGFATTGAANPMMNKDGIIAQWTKPSDIQPTSVISVPVVFETNARYPVNINNMPVITATTGIIEDSFLNPTQVTKVLETTALVVPLTNEDASEAPSSTGQFNFIEPSTVVKVHEELTTTVATPNLVPEKPNEVLSTQPINPTITQTASLCTCTFYEDINSASLEWFAPGYPLTPHFKPQGSKIHVPRRPINIYQKFINLHFNLFVNNNPLPILSANMYPYY